MKNIRYIIFIVFIIICTSCVYKDKSKIFHVNENFVGNYVKTKNNAKIYKKIGIRYVEIGSVSNNTQIAIKTFNTDQFYYQIMNSKYYLFCENVERIKNIKDNDNRYKKYIPFSEILKTKSHFSLYRKSKKIYEFNIPMDFNIYIKDNDFYMVEYQNNLYKIKNTDVGSLINYEKKEYAKSVPVLNYHFFYDKTLGELCNQDICLEKQVFKMQLDYLKKNKYLTLTMKEFELFMNNQIQLPKKSVLITIDDGGMGVPNIAQPMLDQYKMNASLFLITSWWTKNEYTSKYLELHSHSHNLHTTGVCPLGQGGGIRCLSKEEILNDLSKSREYLNESKYFAYPFYEYNEYAVNLVKETGFSLAFVGGNVKASPSNNKYLIPRIPIYESNSMEYFIKSL